MRPRSPLRLVARLLGFSEQPPRPKTTVREDVNNVGYWIEHGHDPIPPTEQEKILRQIASL